MAFSCFACMAEKLRFRLVQARLRHVLDLCIYVFTSWGFFLFFLFYVLGLFSCSEGVPKVPF